MSVNDDIREQRKKLKGQGFKAHWEYFWEYYKIHTAVVLAVIILISVLVHDITNNKPYGFYAMMINSGASFSQDTIQDGFASYAGIDTNAYQCLIDTSSSFSTQEISEMTMVTVQKIMANISAGELDVIAGDESAFVYFANQQAYLDLTAILPQDKIAEYSDHFYYMDQAYLDYLDSEDYQNFLNTGNYDKSNKYAVLAAEHYNDGTVPKIAYEDMQKPIAVGVIINDSKILNEIGAYENTPVVVGIIATSNHVDIATSYIDYLLEK